MNRKIKLLILIILSLSVYFIYQRTNNKNIKIMNIGDSLSLGINSYGIKQSSYIDYYEEYLEENNKETHQNKSYSKKDLTIKELLEKVKTNSKLKRDLRETHQLFLTVGYNDLLNKLSLEENLNNQTFTRIMKEIASDYQKLITEIKRYYPNLIVQIGYYPTYKDDYYLNKGIECLNKIYKDNNIYYIDTYQIMNNREKYFSNPHSYYPNYLGYRCIANKIIEKSLEKYKKI